MPRIRSRRIARRLWSCFVMAVILSAAQAPAMVAGPSEAKADGSAIGATEVPADEMQTDEEALAQDAAEFAKIIGASEEEAAIYLSRSPLIGELREYLADKASLSFVDVYPTYNPYAIVILSLGVGKDEVEFTSSDPRFEELVPFIEVRHVDYTEQLLGKAMDQVGDLAGAAGTNAAMADIRTGTVTVWVGSEDVATALGEAIQDAERSADLVIPGASIMILVGSPGDEDSFAGNDLNKQDGTPQCTSGFSVQQTGGGALEGVSTAAHCPNQLELSNGDDIVFQAARERDDQDVQWHTTPGHTDQPWMRVGPTTVRNVTAG